MINMNYKVGNSGVPFSGFSFCNNPHHGKRYEISFISVTLSGR